MKHSNQTGVRRVLMISNIFALSLLPMVGYATPRARQKAAQPGWQFDIQQRTITTSELTIENFCSDAHLFRVKNNPGYVSFDPPAGVIQVGPKTIERIKVMFDATRLENKTYRFNLRVVCEDCKNRKTCDVRDHKVVVAMRVTPSASQGPSRQTVDSSSFALVFSEFFEMLARLRQQPWAREESNARRLQSITASVNQLKEKSEASAAPATNEYLESLRMNLAALSTIVLDKRTAAIQLARPGSGFHLVKSVVTQRPPEHGNTNRGVRGTYPPAKKLPPGPSKLLEVVDQDTKIKAEHAVKSAGGWADLVKVSVVTRKDNKIVNGLEVWSVPLLWENVPEERERFAAMTSPSEKSLAPGSYIIGIKQRQGERQRIGGDGSSHQQIELRAP